MQLTIAFTFVFFYLKCPAENAGNGISEPLNLKLFGGSMPPDSPSMGLLRRSNFSSCANTFKNSRYAPASHQIIPKPMVKFCIFFQTIFRHRNHFLYSGGTDGKDGLGRKMRLHKRHQKKNYGWCCRRNLFNSFFITLREHFVTKHITDLKQQYSCESGKTTEMCWCCCWWWW